MMRKHSGQNWGKIVVKIWANPGRKIDTKKTLE